MAGKGRKNRKKGPDWDAIRAEYQAGVPGVALAEKYNVNAATLRSKAAREKWRLGRDEVAAIVQQEAPRRIAEALIEDHVAIARKHFAVWAKALLTAEAMITGEKVEVDEHGNETRTPLLRTVVDKEGGVFQIPVVDTAKDLKEWASGLKAITEGQRLAAGMVDPNRVKASEKPPETVGPDGQPLTGVIALPPLEPPPAPPDDEEEEDAND